MMRFPIPGFVPVPSPEVMRIISAVSLTAGVCLAGGAMLFLFLGKGRKIEKRGRLAWISIGAGTVLILNHGIQLLF